MFIQPVERSDKYKKWKQWKQYQHEFQRHNIQIMQKHGLLVADDSKYSILVTLHCVWVI